MSELTREPESVAGSDFGNASDVDEVEGLWREFKRTGASTLRERLILHYSPLVKYVAGRIGVGLPSHVDSSDLVSYGVFGLIDAIDKFDPERGFKFETYAISRIRGAIIDELRSLDWVPRSVRGKAKDVERVLAKLQLELQRTPADAEVAESMGVTVDELKQIYGQISFVNVAALDNLVHSGNGEGDSLKETLEDDRIARPEEALENEQLKSFLAEKIYALPEREQVLLALYYYEGLTLSEIGQVLNVTESRISQLHTKAMMQLRSTLAS